MPPHASAPGRFAFARSVSFYNSGLVRKIDKINHRHAKFEEKVHFSRAADKGKAARRALEGGGAVSAGPRAKEMWKFSDFCFSVMPIIASMLSGAKAAALMGQLPR